MPCCANAAALIINPKAAAALATIWVFGRDLGRRQSAQRRSRSLVVSGANTYTGQTIVDSGTLRAGSARPSSARRPSRSMAARWTSTASTRR
ncbi:hypothetical protein FJ425_01460 [Mesorhizobium sp. B2-7-2]|nr:hypothetical protein FJ425_01460 [Mesorhizobium sp. B2-7-2]